MITKFKDVRVNQIEETLCVFINVELFNQPETMDNPTVCLKFNNGNFKEGILLERGVVSDRDINRVEILQALYYMSTLNYDEVEKILFN